MQNEKTELEGTLVDEKFRLGKLLGAGGMGKVHQALDISTGQEVAIKILHLDLAQDEKYLQRFLREVELSRKISHPNVVSALSVGTYNGLLYMTMELIKGITLKQKISHGLFDPTTCAKVLIQICKGLSAIHDAKIIHRDLKPSNVLLANDGCVKITDFGVARGMGHSDLTGHDEVIGSTAYIAPEVWEGRNLTFLADIYALGILTHEMMVGYAPFNGDHAAEIMRQHLEVTAPALNEIRSDTPLWLSSLASRMLAKDPRTRPQSANEIVEIIQKSLLTRRSLGTQGNAIVESDLLNTLEKISSSSLQRPEQFVSSKIIFDQSKVVYAAPQAPFASEDKNKENNSESIRLRKSSVREVNLENPFDKIVKTQSYNSFEFLNFIIKLGFSCIAPIITYYCLIYSNGIFEILQNFNFHTFAAISVISYSLLAATPILILGAWSSSKRELLTAWVKYFAFICFLGISLLTYNYLNLKNVDLLKRDQSQQVVALQITLQNLLEGAILAPQKSLVNLTTQNFANASSNKITVNSSGNLNYAPIFLFVYLAALTICIRNNCFKSAPQARQLVLSLNFGVLIPAIAIELCFKAQISTHYKWFSSQIHNLKLGSFNFALEEYALYCAIVNFGILAINCLIIIPAVSYWKNNRHY